jgi:signal transduction histidine kinase
VRIQWPRNPIPSRWRDLAVASVWLVALEVEAVTLTDRPGPLVRNVLVVAVMTLAAIWRRRAPLAFVGVVLAFATTLVATMSSSDLIVAQLYVTLVLPYTAAREARTDRALLGLGVLLAWGIGVDVAVSAGAGGFVGSAVSMLGAWGAGRWLRARRLLNDELQHNTERIEAERASRVRLAVADERTRIARELHSLVAANVSAMVIQAEAVALMLDRDLPAADRAMAAIEQTGRDALSDMRRALGVLRSAGESPSLAPQPGVGQVYALIETSRGSGRPIELSVDGEPGPLPASVDLGIYRILEEALASSVGAMSVQVRFREDHVELEVVAARLDQSVQWPALAMGERVAVCNGAIDSDALAHGRRLRVTLPRELEKVFA